MENRNINTATSGLHKALDIYSNKISALRHEASVLADKGSAHWASNAPEAESILRKIESIKAEREILDSYKDSHLNKFRDATPSCNE